MCYHTAVPSGKQLSKYFKEMTVLYNQPEIFHVAGFSRPTLPVTLNNDIDSIVPARWKFVPFYTKSEQDADKLSPWYLNARGEEIFEKSSYKKAAAEYRGLLYVNGFYEPHATDGKKNDENRFIYFPEKDIFTLGVIYSPWKNEMGERYNTFAVITTDANPMMSEIHNLGKRMPLIIPADKRQEWLLANSQEEVQSLIVPYSGELQAHRTYRVTSARGADTNKPEIQNPV